LIFYILYNMVNIIIFMCFSSMNTYGEVVQRHSPSISRFRVSIHSHGNILTSVHRGAVVQSAILRHEQRDGVVLIRQTYHVCGHHGHSLRLKLRYMIILITASNSSVAISGKYSAWRRYTQLPQLSLIHTSCHIYIYGFSKFQGPGL
jgi:hypothetical protein